MIREILAEARDTDLEAISAWRNKTPEERSKIWSKGLTDSQKSDLAHMILDIIGLVPVGGEVADLINSALYALEEEYFLAALSLACLIPAAGSALGAIKLTTKRIPASATKVIAANSSQISSLVRRVAPELPNSKKIEDAVEAILARAKYGDEIDLDDLARSIGIKSVTKSTSSAAEAWYKNPIAKEEIIKLTRPLLTKVLNRVSTRSYKSALVKTLVNTYSRKLKNATLEGITIKSKEFVQYSLEMNDQLIKDVMFKLPYLIDDMVSTCQIRLIDDINVANTIDPDLTTLAIARDTGQIAYIDILLPRFNATDQSIELLLENSIIHEIRHIIDSRLSKLFIDSSGQKMFSDAIEMRDLFNTMSDLMDIPKEFVDYVKNPSEMWVRVDALRDWTRKQKLTAYDLSDLELTPLDEIPNDIRIFAASFKGIPWESLEKIADAMNKIL